MTRSAQRHVALPVQGDARPETASEHLAVPGRPTGGDRPESAAGGTATASTASSPAGASDTTTAVAPGTSAPGISPGDGSQMIGRLADELLPVLIARVGASRLGELEVRQEGWRVRLRRSANADGSQSQAGPHGARSADRRPERQPERGADSGQAAGTGTGSRPADVRQGRAERERTLVASPAVGYYLPREDLSVGMTLRAGDVLGRVDVLGVQHDVVVPVDGRLTRFMAEAGQAVEYGQALARLEPESRS